MIAEQTKGTAWARQMASLSRSIDVIREADAVLARAIIVLDNVGAPDASGVPHAAVTMRCLREGMCEQDIWAMLEELTDLGDIVVIIDEGVNYYKRTPKGETLLRAEKI